MHTEIRAVRTGVIYTPWGQSQEIRALGPEGAIQVSTASHGGVWIPETMYQELPIGMRETSYSTGGWYEEDCDCCIPFAFFGERLGIPGAHISYSRKYVLSQYTDKIPEKVASSWSMPVLA